MLAGSLELAGYRLHRTVDEAEFEGVAVPGLRAEFYRRDDSDQVASIGRYWYAGRELLRAWGYVNEEHCRYSCVRADDGGWHPPTRGCPVVRVDRAEPPPDGPVIGFSIQDPYGRWITVRPTSDTTIE